MEPSFERTKLANVAKFVSLVELLLVTNELLGFREKLIKPVALRLLDATEATVWVTAPVSLCTNAIVVLGVEFSVSGDDVSPINHRLISISFFWVSLLLNFCQYSLSELYSS